MLTGMRLLVASGLALAMTAGKVQASEGRKTLHVKQSLASTGVDPDARGHALLTVRRHRTRLDGTLKVAVRRLERRASFDVMVAGVKVGTLTTNGDGSGRLRLVAGGHGRGPVLGVDPRGKDILVRDRHGEDVLTGHCPDDTADPNAVACCFGDSTSGAFVARHERGRGHDDDDDDEHEVECKARTPEECVAQGGRVAGDSCLPDPCRATPPDGVRCCIPEEDDDDGEGAECRQRTAEQCAAAGGTMVSAPSCDPNPCQPTPPAEERIRCCEPDDGEVECEHRTAVQCAARHGVDMGPGSCSPNPCAGAGAGEGHGDDD